MKLEIGVWQFVRIMVELEARSRRSKNRRPAAKGRATVYDDWREAWEELDNRLSELGGRDQEAYADLMMNQNVVVKVGGCGMVTYGYDWHERETPPNSQELAEATAPYYLWCVEQFGPERCMFESNFPVDKVSFSYNVMWNAFKRMSKDFSDSERASLFHDTAVRAYRL